MTPEPDRKRLAKSRPIPPFGSVIRWLSEVLQLEDRAIYQSAPAGPHSDEELNDALTILSGHSVYNLCLGEIVTEETKTSICKALAIALRSIPQLPFDPIPCQDLTEILRRLWADYDHFCERLSSFSDYEDPINRCLCRHLTLEFAIRAAAMAELCCDPLGQEDEPIWSKHAQLKKHLKTLLGLSFRTHEAAAEALHCSRNEIGRWLNEIDIPPNGAIRDWDKRLELTPKYGISFGKHHLWRVYVGRRIFDSLRNRLPQDLRSEVLNAYGRLKRQIRHHISRREVPQENRILMLQHLARTGRITDDGLAWGLASAATDPLWRRHIEAICQLDGTNTLPLMAVAETYANAAFARDGVSKSKNVEPPGSFDDALRFFLAQTDSGNGPHADALRLCERAARMEAHGKHASLIDIYAEQTRRNPEFAGNWGCLGRLHQTQGQIKQAEDCFRTAASLNPGFLDYRTDLAFLLANNERRSESLTIALMKKSNSPNGVMFAAEPY